MTTSENNGARALLLVEDDLAVTKAIKRFIPRDLRTVSVGSLAAAQRVLDDVTPLAGAIVDIGLPDGNGMDVVRAIRDLGSFVPILVLTGQLEPQLVNEAHALGAAYVCKPEFERNLESFLDDVARFDPKPERVFDAIQRSIDAYSLTKREAEILTHAVGGVPRGHLAEVMGVSENTLKTQIRSMLDKASQSSLSELVWAVRSREAKLGSPRSS
jgi:DNA-binding NarL/FixJ family response regulator